MSERTMKNLRLCLVTALFVMLVLTMVTGRAFADDADIYSGNVTETQEGHL